MTMERDTLHDLIRGYVAMTDTLSKSIIEYLWNAHEIGFHTELPEDVQPVQYLYCDEERTGTPIGMMVDKHGLFFTFMVDGREYEISAEDISQPGLIYLMRDMFELGHETGV